MIFQALAIPLLYRQIPQRLIIHPSDPAAAAADQHPVIPTAAIGLPQTHAAELAQALIRLQHPETTAGRLRHLQILKHLLQNQHLGLTSVRTEPEPADQHQEHA